MYIWVQIKVNGVLLETLDDSLIIYCVIDVWNQ